MNEKLLRKSLIAIFLSLYVIISIFSTIHVVDFFSMTNPHWISVGLAFAFELGLAATLGGIVILDKLTAISKYIVWSLFCILTGVQVMGNIFYAYTHAVDFLPWMELFGMNDFELVEQKRILAIVSGAILPITAAGFIKTMVDYINPKASVSTKQPTLTSLPTVNPAPVSTSPEQSNSNATAATGASSNFTDKETELDIQTFNEPLKKTNTQSNIDKGIQQKSPNKIAS